MKRSFKIFICLVLILTGVGQFEAIASESWSISFGSPKHFVENKSQFDAISGLKGQPVLFYAKEAGAKIYFTKSGVAFNFEKSYRKPKSEAELKREATNKPYEENEKEEHSGGKLISEFVKMEWLNSNPDVKVEMLNEATGYYSYHINNRDFTASAFEKVIYKNLYNGIDVEYTFHPEGGVEYSLIVHPGADASQVKMKWSGGKMSDLESGNLRITTSLTHITDRAPVTFYQKDAANIRVSAQNPKPQTGITSRFMRDGRIVSFELGSYDRSQTIIIDPNWAVNPGFNGDGKAMDVETDAAGNAYAFGGDRPIELKKYNSAGVWQWTYNTGWNAGQSTPDIWMGTLKTAPNGESYITVGSTAKINKISTVGNLVWTNTPGGAFSTMEYWDLAFNCDFTKLYAGGTSGLATGYIFELNMANGVQTGNVTAGAFNNEVRSFTSNPTGKLYFHTQQEVGEVSTALAINWKTAAGYTFSYGGPSFGTNQNRRGQHVIKASLNYIYTMNGGTLYKRNITTGAVVASVAIPGGATGGGSPGNNGIDLDSCENIYVGSTTQVHKFNSNLTLLSSITTPNGTAIYDVAVSNNGYVYISGNGFVASNNMTACNVVAPICVTATTPLVISVTNTNPLCNGVCSGTGTANITTGTAPYTYSWNNGQSTQTATGLCAGTYSVTVNDALGIPTSSTITVTAPTALSATPSSTNVTCYGSQNGSASVAAGGGSPGYTYNWNTGATAASISNLSGGTYNVTITDTKGCTTTAISVVNEPPKIVLNFPRVYYICGEAGGTVQLTASGGTHYSWTTGGGTLVDDTIVDPLATPFLPSTTYIVTVFNGACFDTAQVTINIVSSPPPPIINYSGDSMWVSQNFLHYQWYFEGSPLADDTLYYLVATQPGHYSVYVTDSLGCKVITQSVLTGMAEHIHGHGIKIFPNPAKNEFIIYGLQIGSEPSQLKIYDAIGQIIYSDQFKGVQKTINCDDWSPGVYFVKVEDSKQSFIEKIIIE